MGRTPYFASGSAASFVASLAVPVAFPQVPQWVGYIGLAIAAALALATLISWWKSADFKHAAVSPIGLDDALRYLANDSDWSRSQDRESASYGGLVVSALRSALSSGDLASRGRYYHELHGGVRNPPLHPRMPIDPSFWANHNINAWWALNHRGQRVGGIVEANAVPPAYGEHEGRHDVRLDRDRLYEIWPKAKR